MWEETGHADWLQMRVTSQHWLSGNAMQCLPFRLNFFFTLAYFYLALYIVATAFLFYGLQATIKEKNERVGILLNCNGVNPSPKLATLGEYTESKKV